MKGIFTKPSYSGHVPSELLGIAEDQTHADLLLQELKQLFPNIIFFHEDIEINKLSSRVMRFHLKSYSEPKVN